MNPTLIDGNLMKLLITNGTIALRNDHQRINDLNVFPVPDGDTGSNMQSTMMSGVNAISSLENESTEKVAKVLSRGLLMGARGNSGVILSQLFSGFAKIFKGKETVTVMEFAQGFAQGVKQAYSAVINPVEGTILTVAREAAEKAVEVAGDDSKGLHDVMKAYIKEAYASLERTPDLLPVLKEAGVVDSGGAGFNVIIDGIILALEGEVLEDKKGAAPTQSTSSDFTAIDGEVDYGYCTEFIVQLKNGEEFNREKFVKRLSRFGDSIAVVSDEEICKVHIHTKTPGDVLNFGQQYGNFATLKIENMSLQHTENFRPDEENHAGDYEDANAVQPHSKYGIITVVNGQGLRNTFREMGVSSIIDGGQTMNPSTEDFINAVDKINADHIIIIPNNGNVMLSAQTAAQYIEDRDVTVLPAKTIAQGYASLTMFDANQDLEENLAEMKELINNVKTGEVTYAVRDTEYKGVEIKKDEFIGIADGEIVTSNQTRLEAVHALLSNLVDAESEIITVMFGKTVEEKELEEIALTIDTHYPDVEVEIIEGNQDIYSYILAVE